MKNILILALGIFVGMSLLVGLGFRNVQAPPPQPTPLPQSNPEPSHIQFGQVAVDLNARYDIYFDYDIAKDKKIEEQYFPGCRILGTAGEQFGGFGADWIAIQLADGTNMYMPTKRILRVVQAKLPSTSKP